MDDDPGERYGTGTALLRGIGYSGECAEDPSGLPEGDRSLALYEPGAADDGPGLIEQEDRVGARS